MRITVSVGWALNAKNKLTPSSSEAVTVTKGEEDRHRQADRQKDRQTERQKVRQTDRQKGRQTDRQTHWNRQRCYGGSAVLAEHMNLGSIETSIEQIRPAPVSSFLVSNTGFGGFFLGYHPKPNAPTGGRSWNILLMYRIATNKA